MSNHSYLQISQLVRYLSCACGDEPGRNIGPCHWELALPDNYFRGKFRHSALVFSPIQLLLTEGQHLHMQQAEAVRVDDTRLVRVPLTPVQKLSQHGGR